MNAPIFCTSKKQYSSYTDVLTLVSLSGFQTITLEQARFSDPSQVYIILSPQQPPDLTGARCKFIWWTLEYGGEYEPDLSGWRGEVWASDPAWATAHDAKFVLMGSHPALMSKEYGHQAHWEYDYLMLAYLTPRREAVLRQLSDFRTPDDPYPGYGVERHHQLCGSHLMLHVHQRDDTHAIAPQRIALAAAYKLPLICERVPDAGVYEQYIPFVEYENLNAEVRSQVGMYDAGMVQERGERLHRWLCEEHTFRMSVEEALKS